MEPITRNVIIIVMVITAGIVGGIFGVTSEFAPPNPEPPPNGGQPPVPPDVNESQKLYEFVERDRTVYMTVKTTLATINLVVSASLLALYIETYRQVRSRFTIGLITVMLSFLAYAISTNPMIHDLLGFRTLGLGPFTMIPDAFMMVALCMMLYLSQS